MSSDGKKELEGEGSWGMVFSIQSPRTFPDSTHGEVSKTFPEDGGSVYRWNGWVFRQPVGTKTTEVTDKGRSYNLLSVWVQIEVQIHLEGFPEWVSTSTDSPNYSQPT